MLWEQENQVGNDQITSDVKSNIFPERGEPG